MDAALIMGKAYFFHQTDIFHSGKHACDAGAGNPAQLHQILGLLRAELGQQAQA